MNPIELMRREIAQQINIKTSEFDRSTNPNDLLFVGSGDSFVSGLIASYESNFSCLCFDPVELIINPIISKDKRVCFISISGKTNGNILAAKKVRKYCKETIAITANPNSLLAKNCMRIIELNYQIPTQATSGTLGFLLSTITALSLIKGTYITNIKTIFNRAENLSNHVIGKIKKSFLLTQDQSICFLGNTNLFPISYYGSLKINEVFGLKSFPYSLEQFCHSPLFSFSPRDILIILSCKNQRINKKARKLNNLLNAQKYCSICIEIPYNNTLEILLMSIFFIQLFVYGLAEVKKLKTCHFLKNKELLNISSELIY